MNRKEILQFTEDFVRSYMADKEAGHNWWHIKRVRDTARYIRKQEQKGDLFVIELAALLHDIGDDKIDPDTNGNKLVRSFLRQEGVEDEIIHSVTEIMAKISFRDNLHGEYSRTPELDIVQDADRLDAIGAIGIARAFAYGGSKGNEIYKPGKGPREYKNKNEYHNSDSSTINHFYEKLLLLKDRMNTDTGKQLAHERHRYMEEFLQQFFKEWNGEEL
ncbi:MAG: HD domain-containing protein [Marinilabiliaceae bacterium]|jgi:uncharacterized protein|nr:HD domain-containing protein [Marinilabiliaceae bacterium]